MRETILVVDDEPDATELVEFHLKQAGYKVMTAGDGAEALTKARSQNPSLVVLDLMLPEVDGLEVCRTLRRNSETFSIPIIMLTARAAEMDRIVGLELGADDYITKPFSPRELVLRIKKLLQRSTAQDASEQVLQIHNLRIDPARFEVKLDGELLRLTATEFKLLILLAQRRGRVQSREQLLRDVWDYNNSIDTRTVDTHIRRLRNKLGSAAKYLDAVHGVGYRLVEE